MSDKLLSCPFCGSGSKSVAVSNVDCMTQDNRPYIGCSACHANIKAITLDMAIKAWNTRKPVEIDKIIYILKNMNDEKDYGDGSGVHQSSFERYESNRMSKGVLIKNIAKAIAEGLNK